MVTLPALTALGMAIFVGDEILVEVPVSYLVSQMVMFLLIPIASWMALRARWGDATKRAIPWINRVAMVAVILLTFTSAAGSETELPSGSEFTLSLIAAALWTLFAMAIGYGIASSLRLGRDDRFTFLIEFSARNIALAFIVAVSSLGQLELGFFSGSYAMTGFPAVIAIAAVRGRLRSRATESEPSDTTTAA